MEEMYVLFKDDDAGKDFYRLKKWVDVVLENKAKGAIGLIGKYMKNQQLREFLNSLDQNKIEVFCHGYKHSYLPFLIRAALGAYAMHIVRAKPRLFSSSLAELQKDQEQLSSRT